VSRLPQVRVQAPQNHNGDPSGTGNRTSQQQQ
jgi:hypothetical protein